MQLIRLFGILAFAVMLGSCVTEPTYPPSCSGPIKVTGTWFNSETTFTWEPRCGVSQILVTETVVTQPLEQTLWNMWVPEDEPLRSGVKYGVTPERGHSNPGPKTLSCQHEYRVSVYQTVGGDVTVASGSTTFKTPACLD